MIIDQPDMNYEEPIDSWKEIGAYLQRNEATARRWEREEGLPVHRHSHKKRSSVYAYPSEIDAWRRTRKVAVEEPPLAWWAPPRSFAFVVTITICLIMVGNGVRPASAQARGASKSARQIWLTTPGQDPTESAPSADGRYIAFTNWETGDLGVRDLSTGKTRLLTRTGGWEKSGDWAEGSAVSADGRWIAYAWSMETSRKDELRVIPTAGGPPRTLHSGPADEYTKPLQWSTDGKQLLVLHSTEFNAHRQLALVSVTDGSFHVVKDLGLQPVSASLSPDGRFVAYEFFPSDKSPSKEIRVISSDGGQDSVVVAGRSVNFNPLWTPDGSRILFLTDRTGSWSLWEVAVSGGRAAGPEGLVKADIGKVNLLGISRKGALDYVLPGVSNPNIYSAELGPDGRVSKAPALASERYVNSNNGSSLSPDGKRLAFLSHRPGGSVLVIRTLASGEEREAPAHLAMGVIFGIGPMWFPGGESVLAPTRDTERNGFQFHRVNLETGADEVVHRTGMLQGYQLSPDGKALFYTEVPNPGVPTRLIRYDFDSRRETVLKSDVWAIAVAVSPDSKQLAYLVSVRPGADSYIAVIPSSGGESREVFRGSPWMDGSRYSTLAWTPDGKYLMFVRGGVGDNSPNVLWRVPVAGGQAEQMGLSMLARIKTPQIDPSGRRLYFSATQTGGSEVWALENFLPKADGQ